MEAGNEISWSEGLVNVRGGLLEQGKRHRECGSLALGASPLSETLSLNASMLGSRIKMEDTGSRE